MSPDRHAASIGAPDGLGAVGVSTTLGPGKNKALFRMLSSVSTPTLIRAFSARQ
ncbi:Alcohol dehydrogenase class-3, partial [Clarias magur]